MIAGVAGGIGERFEVDVNIVRVVLVVLTCLWGLGAAIYLAMWALVPSDRPTTGGPDDGDEGGAADGAVRSSWLTALLVAGALCVGLLFVTTIWGGPRWGGGIGFGWFLFLVVVLVLALRNPMRRTSFGRVVGVLTLAAISLFVLAVGAFFAVVALTGVPLSGGIGDRVWQPTSVAQVQPTYRTAIGNMTVDLREVPFTKGIVHVTASVAVGKLLVAVPSGLIVDVTARSGVGNVVYENGSVQAFIQPALSAARRAHGGAELVLDAEAGVGQVQLLRAPASAG
jgi:phage shock protein PspC (stress-responsive transcriptional regulator)